MAATKSVDLRDVPRYGIKEVAHYLGIPLATFSTWINGRKYRTDAGVQFSKPLIEPAAPGLLSFYNLIEAHILGSTRRRHKVEMPSIRAAIDYVGKKYPSKHPLLSERFLTDGRNLFIKKLEGEAKREQTINVSMQGQLGFGPILDLYLRRIGRDEQGWPAKLFPIRANWIANNGDLEPPCVVVIDPAISSGRPVVNGTGVMAEIISGRFNSGEGVESIADDYGLEVSQIEEVIRYAPAA